MIFFIYMSLNFIEKYFILKKIILNNKYNASEGTIIKDSTIIIP